MVERVSSEVEVLQADIMSRECGLEERIEFIHSGNSMFNLPMSGKIRGGLARARVINIVGDGSSGKTLISLEAAAWNFYNWSQINSGIFGKGRKLTINYNNREGVMDFPVEYMYGQKFYDAVDWTYIPTIEAWGKDFFQRLRSMGPKDSLIAIVDSWDSMDSEADLKKFEKDLKSKKSSGGEDDDSGSGKGTYALGKQSYASKIFFKRLCDEMRGKDVTLIIVSQTRTKIGVTFGKKKYRAGGDALDFYTHQVVWLSEVEKLTKQVLGHKRVYGIRVRCKVERSKVWKPFRESEFVILFDYGVDDIESMMAWYFGPKKEQVEIWGDKYKREEFAAALRDDEELLEAFRDEVQALWDKIEDTLRERTISMPPKYGDQR